MPSKLIKKHIIKDNDEETEDEPDEKPSVVMFPSKGKDKVLIEEKSDDNQDDIDAELEATATRVIKSTRQKKSWLDIIAEVTS